ncbi:hypothetical protein GGI15_004312 [Coemansia interrupta]|uniref:Uncharacterized protein n=1 Tax=Coemansia interrupta TaxID=1126814 RepID=A0A9W8LF77_9FUNG|nr:hypothetical protein GGI15_004312 [Coemansia interrupta]
MKFSIISFLSVALGASLVAADVAGTRTVVISLATGDDGQIIPVIMHKNSAGYEPLVPSTSENATGSDSSLTGYPGSEDQEASADAEASQTIAESALESPFPMENATDTPTQQESEPESEQQSSPSPPVDDTSDAVEPEDTAPSQETTPANVVDSDSESDSENEADNISSESAESVKKSWADKTIPSIILLALSTWFFAV